MNCVFKFKIGQRVTVVDGPWRTTGETGLIASQVDTFWHPWQDQQGYHAARLSGSYDVALFGYDQTIRMGEDDLAPC